MISQDLFEQLIVVEGDGFDTTAVADAIRKHNCDALVNSAGNREPLFHEQIQVRLAEAIIAAAVLVGKERAVPLRAWILGGMGSLNYPGTNYKIEDYMPAWTTSHHRGKEPILQAIPFTELEWSMLCVAMMYPKTDTIKALSGPEKHNLIVGSWNPPDWQDHWIRKIPFLGTYLNLIPCVAAHWAYLEDVADFIAEDLCKKKSEYIGAFVGFKIASKSERS